MEEEGSSGGAKRYSALRGGGARRGAYQQPAPLQPAYHAAPPPYMEHTPPPYIPGPQPLAHHPIHGPPPGSLALPRRLREEGRWAAVHYGNGGGYVEEAGPHYVAYPPHAHALPYPPAQGEGVVYYDPGAQPQQQLPRRPRKGTAYRYVGQIPRTAGQ